MYSEKSQAAYRSASADGTTQIGLHVLVYNHLAGDLLRAGEAAGKQDIRGRCAASNRAVLLLGHLEAWTDYLDDTKLVESLKLFYKSVRGDVLRLQAKGTPEDFRRLSERVLELRSAWQSKEQLALRDQSNPLDPQHAPSHNAERDTPPASLRWCA